jgi:hypothetical protein
MNKNSLYTFTVGMSFILLLLSAGATIITTTLPNMTVFAQTPPTTTTKPIPTDLNATAIRLGDPLLEEKGRITSQKEMGPDKTEYSFSANGTLKGNLNITNIGTFWTISRGDNVTYGHGQGAIMTKDDSEEKANYTFVIIGNITEEGKPVFRGSSVYNTTTTGMLAFLDNLIGIYKGEIDEMGNFVSYEWEWK